MSVTGSRSEGADVPRSLTSIVGKEASRGWAIWDRWGILAILLSLIGFLALIAPNFASVANIFNIGQAVSVSAVLAAGATVVILTAGIDLSVGSLVAVTGVVFALMLNASAPPTIAMFGGIAVGGLAGLINGAITAYLAIPAFIVTLGALTYLRGFGYWLSNAIPVPINDPSGIVWMGSGSIAGVPVTVIIMIAVYVILWYVLERTRYGRHVYAVGGNIEAARLAGVRVRLLLTSAYVISGLTAGLAGVMFATRVQSGQVTAGVGYELDAITAVIVGGTSLFGGRGRIFGTLIGALIIGVLNNGLILLGVPFYTQLIVQGAVVVAAVALDRLKSRSA